MAIVTATLPRHFFLACFIVETVQGELVEAAFVPQESDFHLCTRCSPYARLGTLLLNMGRIATPSLRQPRNTMRASRIISQLSEEQKANYMKIVQDGSEPSGWDNEDYLKATKKETSAEELDERLKKSAFEALVSLYRKGSNSQEMVKRYSTYLTTEEVEAAKTEAASRQENDHSQEQDTMVKHVPQTPPPQPPAVTPQSATVQRSGDFSSSSSYASLLKDLGQPLPKQNNEETQIPAPVISNQSPLPPEASEETQEGNARGVSATSLLNPPEASSPQKIISKEVDITPSASTSTDDDRQAAHKQRMQYKSYMEQCLSKRIQPKQEIMNLMARLEEERPATEDDAELMQQIRALENKLGHIALDGEEGSQGVGKSVEAVTSSSREKADTESNIVMMGTAAEIVSGGAPIGQNIATVPKVVPSPPVANPNAGIMSGSSYAALLNQPGASATEQNKEAKAGISSVEAPNLDVPMPNAVDLTAPSSTLTDDDSQARELRMGYKRCLEECISKRSQPKNELIELMIRLGKEHPPTEDDAELMQQIRNLEERLGVMSHNSVESAFVPDDTVPARGSSHGRDARDALEALMASEDLTTLDAGERDRLLGTIIRSLAYLHEQK